MIIKAPNGPSFPIAPCPICENKYPRAIMTIEGKIFIECPKCKHRQNPGICCEPIESHSVMRLTYREAEAIELWNQQARETNYLKNPSKKQGRTKNERR